MANGTVIWSELHQKFQTDGSGSIQVVKNVDAVIASIDNILRTTPGERVYLPEFGAGLNSILFEPMDADTNNTVANLIKSSVEKWDDRVTVVNVDFEPIPDDNQLNLAITFNIRGNSGSFTYNTSVKGGV